MKRLRHAITLACLVAVSALGLYGCGGESPTATTVAPTATTAVEAPTATTAGEAPTSTTAVEAPTATTASTTGEATATTATTSGGGSGSGSATDLLKTSGEAMKSVKSYHIILKTEAAGVSTTGEGDFVVPDKARLTMSTQAGNINVILVDNATYTRIPGSDAYIETTGVSPLGAPTDTSGFADLAQNATVVGDETLDGVDTTHVKFSYDADKAMAASGAAPTTGMNLGMVDADVWIEKSTNYMHQLMTSSTVAGTPSSTTITYSKFNEEITPPIEKPTNIQQMPEIPTIPSP